MALDSREQLSRSMVDRSGSRIYELKLCCSYSLLLIDNFWAFGRFVQQKAMCAIMPYARDTRYPHRRGPQPQQPATRPMPTWRRERSGAARRSAAPHAAPPARARAMFYVHISRSLARSLARSPPSASSEDGARPAAMPGGRAGGGWGERAVAGGRRCHMPPCHMCRIFSSYIL
jgi:hypothetical protein